MSNITESIDVDVPVPAAYHQWTQFESFPWFMEAVESVTQHDDTMTRWEIDIAGVRRQFNARITVRHQDERLAWESVDGPRHAGVVTFRRLDDDTTRVTLQLETGPDGVAENIADARGFLSRRAQRDLRRFKEFIERRSVQSGSWRGKIDPPIASSY
jgi:uncharacterized membrane protein